LRACLVFWDDTKKRYRITTPKTAKTCKGIKVEAVFFLTEQLEKRDLPSVSIFQQAMQESEIAATFTKRGRVGFQDLQALEAAPK
jgi:hypothetical protein